MKESFLEEKLAERRAAGAMRQLRPASGLTDYYSNDYLGIACSGIGNMPAGPYAHGSTGSRLLSGNSSAAEELEEIIAAFHKAEAALLFNSGYDANLGLLSSVPQRGDHVFYDRLSHASIRDGVRLSQAQHYSFEHNDPEALEKKLSRAMSGQKFVVTESVFSMDGDKARLPEIAAICNRYGAHLIVDEAHGFGVIGNKGEGLVQDQSLQDACFARVYTYGKAAGAHGAVVAGSRLLKDYLVNFSRSFIYTTALPLTAVAAIRHAYDIIPTMSAERGRISTLVDLFRESPMRYQVLDSDTPIQGVLTGGNEEARSVSARLAEEGFDVRPILYPTVPKGSERLRIILHAFNTVADTQKLISCLQ
ncbi:aminotransferase class I/II-fold pyridoxal phosphate-dependent enzyme [Flavihumibacter solisilvae]|uniref:8-amino-7-oxononanoate synthase n=1 Tax=Flavihumibacter solisilvae TaxID=1349421 RepID=A0A0C1L4J8_9BACT|nr:8-amino-7-oxononanoate synthase [Flavihumibacter solisilvae]KIC95032.1 8-amino-7-oxononanoate synthase [Flavihumibacter solisilvae]